MRTAQVEPDSFRQTPAACDWNIEIFYDGDCPLCQREVRFLRWLDRHRRIRYTDIAAPEFNPVQYGQPWAVFTTQIQGRLPDGSWVQGVEVLRRVYSALGFSWVVAVTRVPGLSHLLDWAYGHFAKNRLRWTGRCATGSAACREDSR